jgi:putative ABC transport system permease protein
MSSILQDLRFAVRLLVVQPLFAIVAVVTLGVAIGANATVFSVVDSVLLQPLPYPDADRLVRISTRIPAEGHDRFWLSAPEYWELVEHTSSFESLGAWSDAGAPVSGGSEPARVPAAYLTASTLPTIGVAPELGRFFTAEEDRPGLETVALLSHRLWQRSFGGDPSVVGRSVSIDGLPVTVVGVMPEDFAFPRADTDLWIPFCLDPAKQIRDNHMANVVARLAPGVTLEQARADLDAYVAWSARSFGADQHHLEDSSHPVVAAAMLDEAVAPARLSLLLLQGAVAFLLLIAAANIASLLLARADARQREIAIRAAVGASRGRIVRQLLTESLLLGLLGAGLGLAIAAWGVDLAVALLPDSTPRKQDIGISGWVVAAGVGVSLLTSLLFGLAPALRAGARDLHGALKDAGGRSTAGRARLRLRRALVIGEVALAVVLLVGCGLVVHSFRRLQEVDLGFEPDGVVTMFFELPQRYYPEAPAATQFWADLTVRVRALPGVEAATTMTSLPFEQNPHFVSVTRPGRDAPDQAIQVYAHGAGDDYATTAGIRVLGGRAFDAREHGGPPHAVLVNRTLARALYPDEEPIGRALSMNFGPVDLRDLTILGVLDDVKQAGIAVATPPQLYLPSAARWDDDFVDRLLYLVVRVDRGDPRAVVPDVRRIVADLDPRIAVSAVRTMDELLWQEVARPRFLSVLLAVFSGIALLLAAIGIFGVMSHSVTQRTRELGIRMALGAPPALVRRMVLRDGLTMVGLGLAVGLAASLALAAALSGVLAGVLFGVGALDLWPLLVAPILLVAVGAAACWWPAARATRIDPMLAMRHD